MPSFLSGSVGFVRYRAECERPHLLTNDHLEHLRGFDARLPRLTEEKRVCAWTAGDSILDTDFSELKNIYPDHLVWDFWTQTNDPPPELLKAYYVAELKALTRSNPSGFPSARQKREAKEAARDRIEEEAKDGRFRKRKTRPVLWDSITNQVYFGGSGEDARRFPRLFEQTFSATLAPITAGEMAVRLEPRAADESVSEFVPGLELPGGVRWQVESDGPPDFLGNEFLLWLWWYTDTQDDTIALGDDSEVTVWFSGGVKVEDPVGQRGTATINSASAVRLAESRAAVRYGKLPRKAALTLVRHDEQFAFVLQAETLAVSSAKLPKPPDDILDARAQSEYRLQAIRDLAETVDQLYAAFLTRRLAGGWALELKDVQSWLRRDGRMQEA